MFKPIIIIILSSLTLSACGYKPLYGVDSTGQSVSNKLSRIVVDHKKNRQDQLIRNEIIGSISSDNVGATHQLSFVSNAADADTLKAFNTDTLRKSYQLSVKFNLVKKGTGKSVLKGNTFAHVSYDKTAAPFSDHQARISAQERAAKQVANDIRTRLAAHFASR